MSMTTLARAASGVLTVLAIGGCSTGAGGAGGALGDILGSVLGGGGQSRGQQVAGTIRAVDTRSQQISMQQSNGQTVGIGFDNNTKVVYQNQLYSVTALENGDQINMRVIDRGNNSYYTDSVHVTQSVQGSGTSGGSTSGSTNVQNLQGTVRSIDKNAGWFTIDASNSVTLTVTLPYRPSSTDANRFQNLRVGDFVRFQGVFVNNTRVELRQFQ